METSTEVETLLYTVEGAAQRLSLGRSSTYKLINSGQLRSTKLGKRRMISEAALQDFVAGIDGRSGLVMEAAATSTSPNLNQIAVEDAAGADTA